ncbi:hypothetical protein I5Q82_16460 [Acutalibacter muris]|jgi:hypothetical protein|uniref:Bypass of forespore C C-terminal domain-containing protein n=1 Tax=Acutalibacter muris TaxID=1796620 RepID=A0A1Z2XPG0_9FIRM|nr:hypothetical protein [Acutalibacter muris]ANU53008.1 hypothetical protein A4V00_02650 [Hungateiclostridiaceae bacterium KB18]ASB40316.1 hypothetical protein ADH66_06365 [Acutalibacter muris]QQR29607.1 hypothetical protein I5Q82_16460 [Acutalibacter muris]
MTYRRYKTLTIILLIVTVIALLLSAVMLTLRRSGLAVSGEPESPPENPATVYYTPKPAPSQENSETEESKAEDKFLVTIYRGGIGVFQPGKSVPVLTKHTEVYLLPEEDIKLLRDGIWARDLSHAKEILEDFD